MEPQVSVSITPYAATKAQYLATRVSQLAGQPLEIFALPIVHAQRFTTDAYDHLHYAITDIYIPRQQRIYTASFTLETSRLEKEVQAAGLQSFVSGWIHSHGAIDIFHSGTDTQNLKNWLDHQKPAIRQESDGQITSYTYVPSIVFNQRDAQPQAQLFVKKRLQVMQGGIAQRIDVQKYAEPLTVLGIERRDYPLDDPERASIDERIRQVLNYNGITTSGAQIEQPSVHPPSSITAPIPSYAAVLERVIHPGSIRKNLQEARDHLRYAPAGSRHYLEDVLTILQGRSTQGRSLWRWRERMDALTHYAIDRQIGCILWRMVDTPYIRKMHLARRLRGILCPE